MSYKINIPEEELKNKIAQDYFWIYDHTKIIGNVDFCVSMHKNESLEQESLLWAEAKKGQSDIYKSFVQLILTIGKARTFDNYLPPPFLGAFDAKKIAFIPYSAIYEIFYLNDFNWNITPSNHESKEFKLIHEKVKITLEKNSLIFFYEKDDKELKNFIKENFIIGRFGITKIQIDKNNFISIYAKWFQTVKPSIAVDWKVAKKSGIIDGDFYLADLLSHENETLKEKLFVLLKKDKYELDRKIDEFGMFNLRKASFNDGQKAHHQFWNKYERPPQEEYWDYIVERRDLLVPQDIRERKGSFFTPRIWVELSQKYLADVLGKDWQDDYYIWDCAAGTGNLLFGLANKYNIWASTLDKQDIEVIKDRIKNGVNLLESHVFQFDFLNDDFSKLPKSLKQIIDNPKKRKKLVIYINPPYAEATDGIGQGGKKIDVSKETKMYKKYGGILKQAKNELFAQFFIRISQELKDCKLAQFSTLKHLQSPNFKIFREVFRAELKKLFLVPANTFDNVEGKFPIGFMIWNLAKKENFKGIISNIYNSKGNPIGQKNIFSYNGKGYINYWIKQYNVENESQLGYLVYLGNDFQHASEVRISSFIPKSHASVLILNKRNIIIAFIYLSVRQVIKATWLNDRDQFLYPNNKWKKDLGFQNDCLTFTLFHGQNRISSKEGTNHWIPFTENEVDAKDKFESNFMTQFIKGKIKIKGNGNLLESQKNRNTALEFSTEAKALFEAGRQLWKYYHTQENCLVNASLYDIRAYFQGRNAKTARINSKSTDEKYNLLINSLREKLKTLAQKIEPKIYDYGFLKK